MPRDLFPALTRVPKNNAAPAAPESKMLSERAAAAAAAVAAATASSRQLHPFTQILTSKDVDSCTRLEEAAFPPDERASREKFAYRLRVCPELSLGIFTSGEGSETVTAATAAPVDSNTPARKAILLGHIVATKTTAATVTDDDMAYPTQGNSDARLGHKEHGRCICIHSLAVLPEYQKQKLGSTLMRAYIERMSSQDVADSLALIAHDHLIRYYEHFGFKSLGPSQAQFGGGGWIDMVLDLKDCQRI